MRANRTTRLIMLPYPVGKSRWRNLTAVHHRIGKSLLFVLPLLLFACPTLRAQAGCGGPEARRVLADMTQLQVFLKAKGNIAGYEEDIRQAHRLLDQTNCEIAAVVYAEEAVSRVYFDSEEAALGESHLEAACRFSEQVQTEMRWDLEFDCKGLLLLLVIQQDRFEEAKRLTQELSQLATTHGIPTTPVVANLMSEQIHSVAEGRDVRTAAYQEAIEVLAQGEAKTELNICKLTGAAETHFHLGEYQAALAEAGEAHRLLETEPEAKRSAEGLSALLLQGTIYLNLEDPANALRVFEEAASFIPGILEDVRGNRAASVGANFTVARLYGKMAVAQLLLNQNQQAQNTVAHALHAAQASGLDGLAGFLNLDKLQAQAKLNAGNLTPAEQHRLLDDLFTAGGDVAGDLFQKLRNTVAPNRIDELLRENPQLLALSSREARIQIYSTLGHDEENSLDNKAAIRNYIDAITLIEDARFQARDLEALPAFFASYVSIYDRIIGAMLVEAKRADSPVSPSLVQFGNNYPEIALYFSEAAHARQFSERYGRALLTSFAERASLPADVRKRERELRRQAGTALDSTVGCFETRPDLITARQGSEAATTAYLQFLETLKRQYPEFATLAFPRPVALAQLPPSLNGTFLVEYKVTDSGIYWWLAYNGAVLDFDRSDITSDNLRARIKSFLKLIDDPTEATQLVNVLVTGPFTKIEKLASARNQTKPRVIVIPDDILYTLPWEALPDLHGGVLGDSFIISYAPSLTVLAQAARVTHPAQGKAALVIGNVMSGKITIPIDGNQESFDPLQTAEAIHVVSALKNSGYIPVLLEQGNATQETLLGRDETQYELIHFDTHGFAQSLDPLPSLILHPSPASPFGLLTLSDVMKLRLRARLVTLSACETGLGRTGNPLAGEGVQGLAQGFMEAGAKSVLVSLWQTDVEATRVLMEEFYKQLGGGADEATALYRAKAALRSSGFKSANLWAPFILVGDPK